MASPRGYVIYRGPSMIDGSPIVAIATLVSNNRKTGDMIQVWILPDGMSPLHAIATGADYSICGNCRHRGPRAKGGNARRTCYVNVGQAPEAVHKGLERGLYPTGPLPTHKPVRMGAYGDPAAVPFEVWAALRGKKHTGYTHQWRTCDQRFRDLCMASCDSPAEAMEAARMGWKAFLVHPADWVEEQTKGTIQCLSDRSGLSCERCGVCDGTKVNVWIRAHGSAKNYV